MDATSTMFVTHLDLRCHVTGGGLTLHDTYGWGIGLPVPKVPEKKWTNGQKKSQSISEDQLGKKYKKEKRKEGPRERCGAELQCESGNTPLG